MVREFGLPAAAGVLSALLFASGLGGPAGALLTLLAPLPLMLAGLSIGGGAAAVAGAGGLLVVLGLFGSLGLLYFTAVVVLPAGVVVRLALSQRLTGGGDLLWLSPGAILGWLTAIVVVLLIAGGTIAAGAAGGLEAAVRALAEQEMAPLFPAELDPGLRATMIALWTGNLPAMLATGWLITTVINASLAQGILARARRSLRPSPAYADLELPDWLAPAILAAMVASLFIGGDAGYLAHNVAVTLAVPYVLAGLAVVHRAVRGRSNRGLLLAAFYALFVLLFGWAVMVVAAVGLMRHWARLGRRFARRGQEEE